MRRLLVLAASTVALTGCLMGQPGADAKGRRLQASASVVAVAIKRYHRDHHRFPPSLQQLVPSYVSAIPAKPELLFDLKHKLLTYSYTPSWPQAGEVICSCALGETEFQCVGTL